MASKRAEEVGIHNEGAPSPKGLEGGAFARKKTEEVT